MARHESNFIAEREVNWAFGSAAEGEFRELSDRERQDAIVCYLTRSEGWQQALQLLGGAFAPDPRVKQSSGT
ncbi:hypothetical protein G7077_05715 [Sphingomonas piscis]|uniref:Uncharacterized protein n=1 Tax=Sphingomonas piscis TaxID=2714943 RepID=A0A6G7YP07_9SPHN|nr:hypothetical protein [Sphingomonas piscis]QIK78473.1 hypothetical protein G7077_05715 [Sphingomonas piscis]